MKIFEKEKLGDGRRAVYFLGLRILYYKRRRNVRERPNCDIDPSASIDSATEIGDYTYIGKDVDITDSKIGRYCSIASHVRIGQGEHDIGQVSMSGFLATGRGPLMSSPCEIGNDVWIGTEAIVRRGVKVGDFAVIGANSFVNRDVPDFAIAVGSPARVIGFRFPPEKQARIRESGYWKLPPREAKRKIDDIR